MTETKNNNAYRKPPIDRFHKWRPINYSFVYVLIGPSSLVLKEHFICILSVLMRLVGLNSTNFSAATYAIGLFDPLKYTKTEIPDPLYTRHKVSTSQKVIGEP